MKTYSTIVGLLVCLCAISCTNHPEEQIHTEPVQSDSTPIRQQNLQEKILVSKGIIKSDNEIPIFSRITGQLDEVKLIDGQKVRKGDILFTLDDRELSAKVNLCRAELEQAQLKMDDILIGQGYKKGDLASVPEDMLDIAKIKSGCNVKALEYEMAKNKLENARIKSPVSGVVSQLNCTSFSYVNPGETLCSVIDTKDLIVEFSILETELRRFHIGSEVQVSSVAFSDEMHIAVVRTIGSIVNEAGMVRVEAEIDDITNLVPGMTAIVRL